MAESILLKLQETVQRLKEKSQHIVTKQSDLADYLRSYESKHNASEENRTLGEEDQETLKTIVTIQHWLLTVKRSRDLGLFRHIVKKLHHTIFRPPQALRQDSDETVGRNSSEDLDFGSSIDEDALARIAQRQGKKKQADAPKVPPGVKFVDGQWVGGDDDDDDDADWDASSDDEEEENEKDPIAAKLAKLKDTAGDGDFSDLNLTGSNLQPVAAVGPDNIDDLEDVKGPDAAAAGPSSRQLHEFEMPTSVVNAWETSHREHRRVFLSALSDVNPVKSLLVSTDPLTNQMQLDWMVHQSEEYQKRRQ